MDNKLGIYVREQRGNLSLREFAKKCDLSHTHIDSIEKGYDPRTGKPVRVTVDTLTRIAKALHISVNELLVISGMVDNNREHTNSQISYIANKKYNKELLNQILKNDYRMKQEDIEAVWNTIDEIVNKN